MKAPEKLYLRKRNKLPLEVVRDEWYETDPQNMYGSIEYTRTDAFIEKATKWLIDNIQNYTDDGMGEHSFVLVQDLKEDFKKYMKEN